MNSRIYLWHVYRKGLAGWLLTLGLLALTWITGAALLALSGWFISASALTGLGLLVGLNIFTPSTAIRGLALLKPVTRYFERVAGHATVLRLLSDLRVRLFSSVSSIPASRWQERVGAERHVDVVTRLTQDVDTLDAVPIRVITPLFAAGITLLAAIAAMAYWGSADMAWLLAAGGCCIFLTAAGLAAVGRQRGRALVGLRATLRIVLHDHLEGLAELHAYRKADANLLMLTGRALEVLREEARQETMALAGEHIVQALVALSMVGVVALGWGLVDGPLLALLALMTLGLGEALGTLPGAWWRVGEAEAAANRLQALDSSRVPESGICDISPEDQPLMSLSAEPRMLVVDGLIARRQPGQNRPWSVSVRSGRPLIIHGASGCGKSSLLDTLAGELSPVKGAVQFNGWDWLSMPDGDRYRRMAYLGQQDHLLDISVREYLGLGLGTVSDDRLVEVLHAVALEEVFRSTGDGLEYRLGPKGSRISGGQARRLQIAALLLREPDLVLLDEPFRGLDAAVMNQLLTTLGPWLSERCCVLVTHAPEALPSCWERCPWPAVVG